MVWGCFGLGLFRFGTVLVWGCFGLGLFWFGVVLVWGCFGGVVSVGLFWFGVVSYCSPKNRVFEFDYQNITVFEFV